MRALQQTAASRLARRTDMLVRMHVLRGVRGRDSGERVPELRRRVRAPADQAVEKLEGRQLPRQGPREREDQAQAGRSHGARDLLGPDQEHFTREVIGIASPSRNESWQTV